MKGLQVICKQLCQMLPPLGWSRPSKQEVSLSQAGGQVIAGVIAFNLLAVWSLLRSHATDNSSPNTAESTYQKLPDLFDPARISTQIF